KSVKLIRYPIDNPPTKPWQLDWQVNPICIEARHGVARGPEEEPIPDDCELYTDPDPTWADCERAVAQLTEIAEYSLQDGSPGPLLKGSRSSPAPKVRPGGLGSRSNQGETNEQSHQSTDNRRLPGQRRARLAH